MLLSRFCDHDVWGTNGFLSCLKNRRRKYQQEEPAHLCMPCTMRTSSENLVKNRFVNAMWCTKLTATPVDWLNESTHFRIIILQFSCFVICYYGFGLPLYVFVILRSSDKQGHICTSCDVTACDIFLIIKEKALDFCHTTLTQHRYLWEIQAPRF